MNRRPIGRVALALGSLLLCTTAGPIGCNTNDTKFSLGPSTGEVVGIAVAIGAVVVGTIVLVEVHHSHHTLKGCVSAVGDGLMVQSEDGKKTYKLSGVTDKIKAGDTVRLHGDKQKKGQSGDQTFVVEKMNKDYGPCKVPAVSKTP